MALFGRRTEGFVDPTLADLRGWHLVLLPAEITVEQVNALVTCRHIDANLMETRRAALGRQSAISGPYLLEPSELAELGIPDGWQLAYALESPREPDPDAYLDIADPQLKSWWMRAFPQGKPFREEGDCVDLGLELARRFGGQLRVAGTNILLAPDTDRWLDLIIWSGDWLVPEAVEALLSPVLPGVRIDLGGVQRPISLLAPDQGPWSVSASDPRGFDLAEVMTEQVKHEVAQASDAFDRHALANPVGVDGYALTADDDVVIEVIRETAVPEWVRDQIGGQIFRRNDPVVTYTIRWLPPDPLALESEDPSYSFKLERDRVRTRLRSAALTLVEATAGAISDSARFEVDRYAL